MRHAAIVYQGDLVVAGGIVGPGEYTASVLRLRPGAGAWEELAPLPLELAGLTLAVVGDTLFALCGDGPFYSRPEQALFAYDASADAWAVRRDIPDWRTYAEAVTIGGKLWLTGGQVIRYPPGEHGGAIIPADTVLEYAPGDDTWTYGITLLTPRQDHEVVRIPGDLTYFVGGEHGLFSLIYPDVEVYDEVGGGWRTVLDPHPTRRIAAAFAEPYIHVVGGDAYRDFHRALDTRSDEWVGFGPLPYPLEWPELIQWQGDLWLIGGLRSTGTGPPQVVDDVWRMDLDAVVLPR
jgi:hypothetical protein